MMQIIVGEIEKSRKDSYLMKLYWILAYSGIASNKLGNKAAKKESE